MNTKKQGDIGVGAAIAYFTQVGATVCIPLTDSQAYDLVVEHESKILRVQVKRTTYKLQSGSYSVSLTVKGGNRSGTGRIKKFDSAKVDAVFIFTGDSVRYLIPSSVLKMQSGIALCDKYDCWKV